LDQAFRKIADDAWYVNAGSAIIDGEVVVPLADGTTDFSVVQNELKGRSTKIVMVTFDLLYLNGYDLRKLPLFQRKSLLQKLIDGTDIQLSESFKVDGQEIYKHACKTDIEVVSLQGPRQPICVGVRQRLDEKDMRAA
jgi:bifunctional non-homologous end joining protein LigD